MPFEIWTAILVTGMASGAALVGLLVVTRPLEPLLLLIALASIVVNTYVVLLGAVFYDDPRIALAIGVASLASAIGGYGLVSSLLGPALAPEGRPPTALEPPTPPDPRIVVLLLACLEPERYSPKRVATQLAELARDGVTEAGLALSPFLYTANKARYRVMGGTSPAPAEARRLAVRLGEMLATDDRFARVELVDCSTPDALARHVASLAVRGFGRFISTELSIGETYEFDRAKSLLDTLRPEAVGLRVAYAQPLWSADSLAGAMSRRILGAVTAAESSGVALVMHGQADSRQRSHPDFDVQEDAFCNRIRMMVAEGGIPDHNVRLCYHDWQTPDVSETVRHLAAVGCEHVVVAPVCFPLQGSVTLIDLPVALSQARVDEHVTTVVLPAWGDDQVVADVLLDRILEVAQEMKRGS